MLAALRNLSRICCTIAFAPSLLTVMRGVVGLVFPIACLTSLSRGARIAGSPLWLLLMLLSPFELGASRNDLADTKLPACERAQERGRPQLWLAAAICGSAAGFDALRRRLQGAPAMWIMSCTRVTLSCPSVRRYLECSRHGRPPLQARASGSIILSLKNLLLLVLA
ncbi:hypothetical protein KCU83_g17, partial [Aureobasidium melanogenum]